MARRFFIPPGTVAAGAITVTGDLYRHMARVLRLKPGATVILADGAGREFTGIIDAIGDESLSITITDSRPVPPPASFPRIALYQGLPKGDKMDLIVQKAVELGAAEIVPFAAQRSVVRVAGREEAKILRWEKIAREAARQSGQSCLPRIALGRSVEEVTVAAGCDVKLMLWERERAIRLKETLAEFSQPASIAVMVGPEGGFTEDEAACAVQHGFTPVSLGERIVRTETAGLVILAILQFFWGDIG